MSSKIMVEWLLFVTAYYLFSMRMILYGIADIAESDLGEVEKGLVVDSTLKILNNNKWGIMQKVYYVM